MPDRAQELEGYRAIRVAGEPDATRTLQLAAARRALADARLGAEDLAGVIALRSGLFPACEAVWLSALHGRDLGLRPDATYLDLKAPACAGSLLGLAMAATLLRAGKPTARLLVVGGGAAGYKKRWFDNPSRQRGEPPSGIGPLLGDGAFAVVVGLGGGDLELLSSEVVIDAGFADTQVLDGNDYLATDEVLREWLFTRSSLGVSQVMFAAFGRARLDPERPAFFIGSNSGKTGKTDYCERLSLGFVEPRFRTALDVQLAGLADYGHVFGGDAIANLVWLREHRLVQPGDTIVALEAGDTFFYSAGVLRQA